MPRSMGGPLADEQASAPRPSLQPVFSRPPVDGSDEELEQWAKGFVEAILGRPLQREEQVRPEDDRR
jgi:hypothetical protein